MSVCALPCKEDEFSAVCVGSVTFLGKLHWLAILSQEGIVVAYIVAESAVVSAQQACPLTQLAKFLGGALTWF